MSVAYSVIFIPVVCRRLFIQVRPIFDDSPLATTNIKMSFENEPV